ncbi:hypothetical protein HPB50_022998 [Hyalomma asiaticum]|uniref:Uncharacterized protein n=1 Tax=Hyalomma asiaticum TaxID=266040 RepID=A0ACB7SZ52_HYAAI|nr:hypothetical protein HPB50_022998 [Hyalomma asiaticum]
MTSRETGHLPTGPETDHNAPQADAGRTEDAPAPVAHRRSRSISRGILKPPRHTTGTAGTTTVIAHGIPAQGHTRAAGRKPSAPKSHGFHHTYQPKDQHLTHYQGEGRDVLLGEPVDKPTSTLPAHLNSRRKSSLTLYKTRHAARRKSHQQRNSLFPSAKPDPAPVKAKHAVLPDDKLSTLKLTGLSGTPPNMKQRLPLPPSAFSTLPPTKIPRVRFKYMHPPPKSELSTITMKKDPACSDSGSSYSSSDENLQLRLSLSMCACCGIVLLCALITAHLSQSLLSNVVSPPTLTMFPTPGLTITAPVVTEFATYMQPKHSPIDNATTENAYKEPVRDHSDDSGDKERLNNTAKTNATIIRDHGKKDITKAPVSERCLAEALFSRCDKAAFENRRQEAFYDPNNGKCVLATLTSLDGAAGVSLCSRGPNRFRTRAVCQQRCEKTKQPAHQCFRKILFAPCAGTSPHAEKRALSRFSPHYPAQMKGDPRRAIELDVSA